MKILKQQSGFSKMFALLIVLVLIWAGWQGWNKWYPEYKLERALKQELESQEEQVKQELDQQISKKDFQALLPQKVPSGYYLSKKMQEFFNFERLEKKDLISFDYLNKEGTLLRVYQRIHQQEKSIMSYLDGQDWDQEEEIGLDNDIIGYLARRKISETTSHPTADFSMTAVEEKAKIIFIYQGLIINITNQSMEIIQGKSDSSGSNLLSDRELIKFANSFIN